MATGEERIITTEDVFRTARGVAKLFDAEEVVIIGSQAILLAKPDIDKSLRMSVEIDAYPSNLHEWQKENPGDEASEYINALLGEGSDFHKSFGFYVDGVDDRTAKLPPDWRERAIRIKVESDDREITVVAPDPNDLVASKLVRGDEKDIKFARLCLQRGVVRYEKVAKSLEISVPENMLVICLNRLKNARHPGGMSGPGIGM